MNKICFGCGVKLQSLDVNKIGFVPENKLNDSKYCQRCFKLMHYGIKSQMMMPKSVNELLYLVNNDSKHVIFLIDFLSISDKVLNIYNKIKGKKLLLISKCDILPKNTNYDHIKKNIIKRYNIDSNIKFISSVNNYGIESLIKYLYNNNIKETYIMGLSNSGKSTLINKIIDIMDSNLSKITTSNTMNTTIDFIRLKINDALTLIDSPGFVVGSFNHDLNNIVKGNIKPITYQMKDGEVLKIDEMLIKVSNKCSLTIYTNNNVLIKKYYKDDINFDIDKKVSNHDLLILGFGFISVNGETSISIANVNSDLLEIRESIFGE